MNLVKKSSKIDQGRRDKNGTDKKGKGEGKSIEFKSRDI